jgi:RNA polymerase sigma-70 factor, ECF subfamily
MSLGNGNSTRSDGSGTSPGDRTLEFVQLLGEHERALSVFVLALVPHWTDADEIVQKTRIRLWEQFGNYQSGKDFGAWARTIAFYQVQTHRKECKRHVVRFSEKLNEDIALRAAEIPNLVDDRREALQNCLKKLGRAKRHLIEQYYAATESLHELAERLGRTYASIRKAIYRTQIALSECIETQLCKEGRDE